MKEIPPSIYNAFNLCPRQAWLMSRNLDADQQNEFLVIGRLIDETTFKREKKKIYIQEFSAMLDLLVKNDGITLVGEIKKSSKTLKSGILQLKYYLYLLEKKGIEVSGTIKIPKEKKVLKVILDEKDKKEIETKLKEIKKTLAMEKPPEPKRIRICKHCAYLEFCWS